MWIGSLGPRMFWGTRATNFSIYTTKMEGAGPIILSTGTKFKRVPCQKNCRVNRALLLTFDKQAGQSQSLVPTANITVNQFFSECVKKKGFPLIHIFFLLVL